MYDIEQLEFLIKKLKFIQDKNPDYKVKVDLENDEIVLTNKLVLDFNNYE